MSTFIYFAYGSNMLAERLVARCSSARLLEIVVAAGHAVDFSKRGADGSGKAALVGRPGWVTYGVLFEIALAERDVLDRHEGPGYQRVDDFRVWTLTGSQEVVASTYIARASEPDLLPYDWYLQLVVAGCEQGRFPGTYTNGLRSRPFTTDPDPARRSAREARSILARCGPASGLEGARKRG